MEYHIQKFGLVVSFGAETLSMNIVLWEARNIIDEWYYHFTSTTSIIVVWKWFKWDFAHVAEE